MQDSKFLRSQRKYNFCHICANFYTDFPQIFPATKGKATFNTLKCFKIKFTQLNV